jgi:hypothetical protein
VCFVVRKTTSKQKHVILTTMYLVSVKNIDMNHLKNEGFVASGSIGEFSTKRECANTSHKHIIPYIKFKYSYYTLGLSISVTKGASYDRIEFVEAVSLTSNTFSLP